MSRKPQRRPQLLRAARKVFATKGYHAAGVSDIVGAAGVARGTFYNYFDSKRAIFQAVLEGLMEEVAGAAFPIDPTQNIPDQVRENLNRIVAAVMDEDVSRLLFAEAAGIDKEADEALRAFYGEAVNRIRMALENGQRMGIVREGDMSLTARCVLGLIQVPTFLAVLNDEPLDPSLLVKEMEGILLAGVMR